MSNSPQLEARLSLQDAVSIVVGTVVGTGVFMKAAGMAQIMGSPAWVILAWLLAGPFSLIGALAYAELGGMMPKTGGEYVFIGRSFGKLPAFLYGWTQLIICLPGATGAVATAFALFLSGVVPIKGIAWSAVLSAGGHQVHLEVGWIQITAIAAIVLVTAVNCFPVKAGGVVQTILTILKIATVVALVGGALFAKGASLSNLSSGGGGGWPGLQVFGAGVMATLWAYTGWYVLPLMSGEIREPHRNVPRSLIWGNVIIMIIYVAVNTAYFIVLPFSEVAASSSTAHPDALPVGVKAAIAIVGPIGGAIMSVAFVFATLGSLNGVTMTAPRIPWAMAQEGLMFKALGRTNRITKVPVNALLVQGAIACVVALSGTFDQITTYALFAMWLFHATTVGGMILLRRREPDFPRPYRMPLYPWLPALFIVLALLLVGNTFFTNFRESAIGLGLIALGIPAYFFFRRGADERR